MRSLLVQLLKFDGGLQDLSLKGPLWLLFLRSSKTVEDWQLMSSVTLLLLGPNSNTLPVGKSNSEISLFSDPQNRRQKPL